MTTPPWGHKPPPVRDLEQYWASGPAVPSERCVYWVRRFREGSWTPNRHLSDEGYYGRAGQLGVWIWESNEVIFPIHDLTESKTRSIPGVYTTSYASCLRTLPANPYVVAYWKQLEEVTRSDAGGSDTVTDICAWWSDWRNRERWRTNDKREAWLSRLDAMLWKEQQ